MDSVYVHNFSPFLFEISNGFGIRWYGLAYLTGFIFAFFYMDKMAQRGKLQLTREQVSDFIFYVAVGTMLGGRLGYALFYSPDLFISFHKTFPYWGLLEVNKGGMASHGGLAGVILACIIFARKYKVMATTLIDLCTFGGTLGIFLGRLANFVNGELYGRECSPAYRFAVKFPSEIYAWGTNEIEKLKGLAPAVVSIGEITTRAGEKLSATTDQWYAWVNSYTYQAQVSIDAFKEALVEATQHHNLKVIEALGPILTPRYPSQLFEAFLEGLLLFIIAAWLWRKPRKPGFISATFGVMYCIVRIIGEQYRLPDREIGFQALGLTRGQWLSIAMLVMSSIYLLWVMRRKVELTGGWGKDS